LPQIVAVNGPYSLLIVQGYHWFVLSPPGGLLGFAFCPWVAADLAAYRKQKEDDARALDAKSL
jgi:hypothetical protein